MFRTNKTMYYSAPKIKAMDNRTQNSRKKPKEKPHAVVKAKKDLNFVQDEILNIEKTPMSLKQV